jgi:hypothetical protein
MNRDTHLIFEAYKKKQQILVTEADIGAEFGPSLGAVASGVADREKNADTYIFKLLKSKNPDKSHDEIVKMIVEPLYNAIFVDNKFSATGSHKDQLAKLQTALENELAKTHPKALSSYTARIIKNFLAPVVKILDTESPEVEGGKEAVKAVKRAVTKAAAKNEVKAPESTVSNDEQQGAGETNALLQYAADQASEGVKEDELVDTIKQHIVQKDPDISEARAKGQAKGIINKLISAKVLSKRGSIIEPGDNADEFAEKGDLSLVSVEPEEYLAHTGLHGGRPKTGREVFGGEGGRYGVDFG